VEHVHDQEGRLSAYGNAAEGWLHLLGVGTFTFGPESIELAARPDLGAEVIQDAHRRLALPLVLAALGHQVLHGSAVLMPAGVVALCAASGTGKSTLAYGFARRGLPAVADDAVAIEPGRAPRVRQLPFALRLRAEALAHFSVNGDVDARHHAVKESLPLAAVCTLERGAARQPRIERLPPADAFPAVLAHAYSFGLADPPRRRSMVDAYLRLASSVPVFRVSVPNDIGSLDSTADAIEDAVAATAS
jgi:hypothetical protein